jgi:hypothetical protein
MGLLEPHGRYRRRDGEADLTSWQHFFIVIPAKAGIQLSFLGSLEK